MFYYIEEAPTTNNTIKNFYSTSLKTHRKKQFRTDGNIIHQMKPASMKRAEMFEVKKQYLVDYVNMFGVKSIKSLYFGIVPQKYKSIDYIVRK